MAVVKFLHIFTVVSLAILHASFDARPVNALSVERGHLGRDLAHAHAEIVKKRGDSKKCRPRPSSASPNPVAPTTTYANNYAPSSKPSEPAQTTSSQPASTNTPASSGSSKIMLAWSNDEQPSLPNCLVPGTRTFVYNWQMGKYPDIDISTLNVEYVPTAAKREDAYNIPNILKAGYAKYVKSFNEPEIIGQANMSPQEAYQLWNEFIKPLSGLGYKLVSPAVTAAGIDWMKTFLGLCNGQCEIYASDYHYYGISADEFKTAVNEYHQLLPSVPVWITEVGCHDYSGKNQPCTQDVMNGYFPGVMSFAESTGWIEKIAWFGWFTPPQIPMGVEPVNSLITCPSSDNKQCKPSSLGYEFINYH